jgi:hypothetical protein
VKHKKLRSHNFLPFMPEDGPLALNDRRTKLLYQKAVLTLRRMPDNKTLIQVRRGKSLWLSKVVPFDHLIEETIKIDRDIYNATDCFSTPFLPDVTRLVNVVREVMQVEQIK